MEDAAARQVVEKLARDAHGFGAMVDRRFQQQHAQIEELKARIDLVPAKARQEIMQQPIEVKLPPGWRQ